MTSPRVWRFTVMSGFHAGRGVRAGFPARRFSAPRDRPTITTSGCSRLAPTRARRTPVAARVGAVSPGVGGRHPWRSGVLRRDARHRPVRSSARQTTERRSPCTAATRTGLEFEIASGSCRRPTGRQRAALGPESGHSIWPGKLSRYGRDTLGGVGISRPAAHLGVSHRARLKHCRCTRALHCRPDSTLSSSCSASSFRSSSSG